jgi:hypothetical protein
MVYPTATHALADSERVLTAWLSQQIVGEGHQQHTVLQPAQTGPNHSKRQTIYYFCYCIATSTASMLGRQLLWLVHSTTALLSWMLVGQDVPHAETD